MHRLYVYYGSLVVFGVSVVVDALLSFIDNGFSAPILLLLAGGGLLLGNSIYNTVRTDPSEFHVPAYLIFGVVLGALLSLLGVSLQLLQRTGL